MATISTRLMRLERIVAERAPESCPFCKGRSQYVFADEPDNYAPAPYLNPAGVCRRCGQPPAGIKVITLPDALRKIFDGITWPHAPMLRFYAKMDLVTAIAKRDFDAAERILQNLHDKAKSGGLYWPRLAGGPR